MHCMVTTVIFSSGYKLDLGVVVKALYAKSWIAQQCYWLNEF